ncbi:MAG: hypothetical protein M0000_07400 [Actinomycetota bacterium]|nr:hypothetical protein [Actinomycetota bacterium]
MRIAAPSGSKRPARPAVLGVDPGMRETGLVVRDGDVPVAACLMVRARGQSRGEYIEEVLAAIEAYLEERRRTHGEELEIAVEDMTPPTPHMGTIAVAGILEGGVLLGAIIGRYPQARLVSPGHHGSAPLAAYPEALCAPGEKRGRGQLRHCRSAYDVAGAR